MEAAKPFDKAVRNGACGGIVHLLHPGAETDNLGNSTLSAPLRTDEHIHLIQIDIQTLNGTNVTYDKPFHLKYSLYKLRDSTANSMHRCKQNCNKLQQS